ncbi:MAG: hypothetical protein GX222_04495 [Ruminococcaceae bacterium]|nr:hypothetical protein [Oscillospiraceae bacterium]
MELIVGIFLTAVCLILMTIEMLIKDIETRLKVIKIAILIGFAALFVLMKVR